MMENEAVKSGEKMGMEGIWLREGGGGGNGGSRSFLLRPTILGDFEIFPFREKIWGKRGLWKITHLPLSPPARCCCSFFFFFIQQSFSFKLLKFLM